MRVLSAFAVLTVVAACQAPPPAEMAQAEMTQAEIAQIEAEVNEVLDEWWAVWSAGEDFDRFISIFADDPQTLWIGDAEPYFGRAEIDAGFRPAMENLQRQDNTPIEWRTIVIAPEVVYTVRINDVTQTDIAGNSSPTVRYAETLVWVKRDGQWRVLIGHGSSPNESM